MGPKMYLVGSVTKNALKYPNILKYLHTKKNYIWSKDCLNKTPIDLFFSNSKLTTWHFSVIFVAAAVWFLDTDFLAGGKVRIIGAAWFSVVHCSVV